MDLMKVAQRKSWMGLTILSSIILMMRRLATILAKEILEFQDWMFLNHMKMRSETTVKIWAAIARISPKLYATMICTEM
ncbi:hypothetical protein Ddc_18327 [Ditylenchus destructor]|nr:hypothetical protein Ddc_18327 [Ditylenchus destructor]